MAYFEIINGITAKSLLELIIVFLVSYLVYLSYLVYSNFKKRKQDCAIYSKHIFYGFLFFFLSMLFELIDSFWLDYLFDQLQLYAGVIAFTLFLIGFLGLCDEFGGNKK